MDWEAGWETRRLSIRYRISECVLVHSVDSTEGACRGTAFSHCPAVHRDAKLILRLSSLIRHAVHVRGEVFSAAKHSLHITSVFCSPRRLVALCWA